MRALSKHRMAFHRKELLKFFALSFVALAFINCIGFILNSPEPMGWSWGNFSNALGSLPWLPRLFFGLSVFIGFALFQGMPWARGAAVVFLSIQGGIQLYTHFLITPLSWLSRGGFVISVFLFVVIAAQFEWGLLFAMVEARRWFGFIPKLTQILSAKTLNLQMGETISSKVNSNRNAKMNSKKYPTIKSPLQSTMKSIVKATTRLKLSNFFSVNKWNEPSVQLVRRKVQVEFESMGLWAELIGVSHDGILFDTKGFNPILLSNKPVELPISNLGVARLQVGYQNGSRVFFKFVDMGDPMAAAIRIWLL